jgi:hypothetical protein
MKIQELQSEVRKMIHANLRVSEITASDAIAMLTVLQFELLTVLLEASKPKIVIPRPGDGL